MKVLSTYMILKAKAFNADINDDWIAWAIEMIEAGYESESLFILAGKMRPYNQFELHDLTDKVLHELKLDYRDKDVVLRNYVYYLISISIDKPAVYYETLRELRDICIDLDMDDRYVDFYLLYYAKDDLALDEVQWYWSDANRDNIDHIIKDRFQMWLDEFNQQNIEHKL